MESNKLGFDNFNFGEIADLLIRLGVLYMLISYCFDIMQPFFSILLWGSLIAIAIYPFYNFLVKILRNSKILASVVLVLLLLSLLVVPSWLISESLIKGYHTISALVTEGKSIIPPPSPSTADWPQITQPVVALWKLASENLQELTLQHSEQVQAVGTWLLEALSDLGMSIFQFIASILLAGTLLIYSDELTKSMTRVFRKLAGENGDSFASVTVNTVRNVFKGVIGVAFIQALLAGIGFFVAGVPYAGLWTVICLILAIIQIGVGPVAIPITIYMFTVTDSLTGTLLAIWMIPVTLSDNILRPILMGRGAQSPMLVIFIGSIGGFIFNGFIGLFLGAVILAISYKLFQSWLGTPEEIYEEIENPVEIENNKEIEGEKV